jgi:arsenate reductase
LLKFFFKPSCGACKKAKAYLDRRGIDYEPLDITRTPPAREFLERAIDAHEPKKSLNARSSAFRQKDLASRELTREEALALMLQDPNLIRRPFFIDGEKIYQGFDAASLEAFLQ